MTGKSNRRSVLAGLMLASMALGTPSAFAEDGLKLAVGQRGNWENAIAELGQKAGIFKKHGLELEILYTQGSGETQQAVISGSVDIGTGVGTGAVMSAFSKGAPVRALGAQTTGSSDLFWYVRSDSPVQSMRDVAGRTIAYSTNGSSTNLIVLGFQRHFQVQAKPVATGNPSSTFTQVMSGQVDVGWSSPPFGLDALEQNRIRIIAHGSDVPSFRNQTVRLLIANASALERRRDVFTRFMRGYRETLDWMYSDPAAIKMYAEWVGIPEAMARRVRDEFYPKAMLDPDRAEDLDAVMADAVSLKILAAPLSKEQLAQLFQTLK
jgi:NitT/TauT family transport system substrate-binding protein